jgi:protease stability complex PrcB-like protein
MRTIDRGAHSNIDSSRQAVARTPAEWNALWKAHEFNRAAPAVDFAHEMVVGVFMGSRPTAGFTVEIVGTEMRDGALVVRYRETAPSGGAVTAQILTSPFHLVAVPRAAGAVTFERIER